MTAVTFLSSIVRGIQQPIVAVDDIQISSNFFLAIFAGVVLALAFQFILTAVSAAAGVTAIGNIKKDFVKSKVDPSGNSVKDEFTYNQDDSSGMSTGVKITTAFGIWSVLTTCIALFGATALALNLSVVESSLTNIVTSLVIWALFFLILFYLETRIAGSLIGNLISAATSGLKSSATAIGSMFATSPEVKIENVIGSTIDRVRTELDSGLNTDKLADTLNNFLSKIEKKVPAYEDIKADIEQVAQKSGSTGSSGKWMAAQRVLTKFIDENSDSADSDKKGKAEKLKELLMTVKEKYEASPGKIEGAKNVVEEFTSMERSEIDDRVRRAQEYLSNSGSDKLSTDNIESTFREILSDPSIVTSLLSNDFQNLDRKKIVGLLDRNTNLEKGDIERYADTVESTMKRIAKTFDGNNEDHFTKRMEGRVEGFFNGTGRQELDYALLKRDIKKIMDDPKDSLHIIKNRFSTFDSDTLRALVTKNQYIDEENIDNVINTLEDGKKEVLDKIGMIETKAGQQVEILKRKAVIQAEHARATAASAAWWLVLSTILSGVAAMVGSAVAL